jgi:hypothetical protein
LAVWVAQVDAVFGGVYQSARISRSHAGLPAVPVLNSRQLVAASRRTSRSGLSASPAGTAATAAWMPEPVIDNPMAS